MTKKQTTKQAPPELTIEVQADEIRKANHALERAIDALAYVSKDTPMILSALQRLNLALSAYLLELMRQKTNIDEDIKRIN